MCVSARLTHFPKHCFYLTLLLSENPCFHYCFPRIKFALSHLEWKFLVIWPQTTFPTSPSITILFWPSLLSWTALWIYFPNNSTLEPLFLFFFLRNVVGTMLEIGLRKTLENRGNRCVILDKSLVVSGPLSHLQNTLSCILSSKFLFSSYIPWRAEPVPGLNLISLFLFWSHCTWNLSFSLKIHYDDIL